MLTVYSRCPKCRFMHCREVNKDHAFVQFRCRCGESFTTRLTGSSGLPQGNIEEVNTPRCGRVAEEEAPEHDSLTLDLRFSSDCRTEQIVEVIKQRLKELDAENRLHGNGGIELVEIAVISSDNTDRSADSY